MLVNNVKLIVSAEDVIQLGVDFYNEGHIVNRANWLKALREGGVAYSPIATRSISEEFEADTIVASVYVSSIAHKLRINDAYNFILPEAENGTRTVSYELPVSMGLKEILLLVGAIAGGLAVLKKILWK